MITHPAKIIRAKQLRKNMSDMERRFWYRINKNQLGATFRRQYPIGPYFADFVCISKKLVIELDGYQHIENIDYDNKRTDYIESKGYTLIRIPNSFLTIEHIDAVIYSLWRCINEGIDVNEYFVNKYNVSSPPTA